MEDNGKDTLEYLHSDLQPPFKLSDDFLKGEIMCRVMYCNQTILSDLECTSSTF